MQPKIQRLVLLALPPVLIATTFVAFRVFVGLLGQKTGYVCGFAVYWFGWCLAVPVLVLGRAGLKAVLRGSPSPLGHPAWIGAVCLGVPLCLGYGYAFPRAVSGASPLAILVSAAVAVVNGPLEELLWRGTYLAVFRKSRLLGYVYPAIAFALWHLSPLSVFPSRMPGGNSAFVMVSGILGLLWGWAALRTGSIEGTSAAHALFDFAGLGGRIYFS